MRKGVAECQGERLDRPPFKVFADAVILDLAFEPPKSLEEFAPLVEKLAPMLRERGAPLSTSCSSARCIRPTSSLRRRLRSSCNSSVDRGCPCL